MAAPSYIAHKLSNTDKAETSYEGRKDLSDGAITYLQRQLQIIFGKIAGLGKVPAHIVKRICWSILPFCRQILIIVAISWLYKLCPFELGTTNKFICTTYSFLI